MSSWTENFTNVETWPLKHQFAYWKSKAMALEYENKLLHDTIRKNAVNISQSANSANSTSTTSENEEVEEDCVEHEQENEESANSGNSTRTNSENEKVDEEHDDGNIEVSEEFIQFLKGNKKYRDDAKQERERITAQYNHEQRCEAEPNKNVEELKRLYGSSWEKILALETSMKAHFISITDSEKPVYWPNIPLNFNFVNQNN